MGDVGVERISEYTVDLSQFSSALVPMVHNWSLWFRGGSSGSNDVVPMDARWLE